MDAMARMTGPGRGLAWFFLARLGQAIAVAWTVATLCFAAFIMLPGDQGLTVAVARYGESATFASSERVREELGLNQPVIVQYGRWMAALATLDLGTSRVSRRPVSTEIGMAAAGTLKLGLVALALSYLLALPLGIAAGLRPGCRLDRITLVLASLLSSVPAFLLGMLLVSLFSLTLRWLPAAGFGTMAHLVLPATTLAVLLAAVSVRVVRHAAADVGSAFYMTFAELKGLTRAQALRTHGPRNMAVPVVAFAAVQLTYVLDGAVVIETLFNQPGLGKLLVDALVSRDLPVVQGAALVFGLTFVAVMATADIIMRRLDPRPTLAERRAARTGAW